MSIVKRKNRLYRRQRRSGNLDYDMLNALTTDISNTVSYSKFKYYDRLTKKFNDPKTAASTIGQS